MDQTEQEFLTGLEKKLWTAADKLRSTLDAAQYKHAVLGLVFLKYVSDSFEIRRKEIEAMLRDEDSDYGVIRSNYDSDEEYEATIQGRTGNPRLLHRSQRLLGAARIPLEIPAGQQQGGHRRRAQVG